MELQSLEPLVKQVLAGKPFFFDYPRLLLLRSPVVYPQPDRPPKPGYSHHESALQPGSWPLLIAGRHWTPEHERVLLALQAAAAYQENRAGLGCPLADMLDLLRWPHSAASTDRLADILNDLLSTCVQFPIVPEITDPGPDSGRRLEARHHILDMYLLDTARGELLVAFDSLFMRAEVPGERVRLEIGGFLAAGLPTTLALLRLQRCGSGLVRVEQEKQGQVLVFRGKDGSEDLLQVLEEIQAITGDDLPQDLQDLSNQLRRRLAAQADQSTVH